jgi:hypothetical protein
LAQVQWNDGQLDRKLCAVFPKRRDFNAPTKNLLFAGRQKPLHARGMSLAKVHGNDQFSEQSADGFVSRVSEYHLRPRVPLDHMAGPVHGDDGIQRSLHNRFEPGFTGLFFVSCDHIGRDAMAMVSPSRFFFAILLKMPHRDRSVKSGTGVQCSSQLRLLPGGRCLPHTVCMTRTIVGTGPARNHQEGVSL